MPVGWDSWSAAAAAVVTVCASPSAKIAAAAAAAGCVGHSIDDQPDAAVAAQ
jgi:hypothetical protein